MGYKELLLVLASIVLISLLTTQINTHTASGRELLQQLEIERLAAAIAQEFIEEAKAKRFDAHPGGGAPEVFTPAEELGREGETYPLFDDLDDYHNLTFDENVEGLDFSVAVQVQYVEDSALAVPLPHQTYFKKMTVTVQSSWLSHSLVLHQIFSYYGLGGG